MSRRAYEKFRAELENDPGMAAKLRERVAEAGPTNEVDTTAAFAQRHGFDVQPADIRKARAEE